MANREQSNWILQLAEQYSNIDQFITIIRNSLVYTLKDLRGNLLLDQGLILCNNSLFLHGISVLELGLAYLNSDAPRKLICCKNLGIAYYLSNDYQRASKYDEQALKIAKQLNDKNEEYFLLGNLGADFGQLKDAKKSRKYALDALILAREFGDRVGEAKHLSNLGNSYYVSKNYVRAIKEFRKSLNVAYEINNEEIIISSYLNIITAHEKLRNFSEIINCCQAVLPIILKNNDKNSELKCYSNLATSCYKQFDFRRAIEYLEKAIQLKKEKNNKVGLLNSYLDLSFNYYFLSNYPKAIDSNNKALEIAKELGDLRGEAKCYFNIGALYSSLLNFPKAIEFNNKSLLIAQKIGDNRLVTECNFNFAVILGKSSHYSETMKYLRKGLSVARKLKDKKLESSCLFNMGSCYDSWNKNAKAIKYYEEALTISKTIKDRYIESSCYVNLGAAYSKSLDYSSAINNLKKGLSMKIRISDLSGAIIACYNLGKALIDNMEKKEALRILKRGLRLSDLISRELIEQEHKLGFYGSLSNIYESIIFLCLDLNRSKEAFEYLEKSKSRAFIDLLSSSNIKPKPTSDPRIGRLLAEEEKIIKLIRNIQLRYLKSNEPLTLELNTEKGEDESFEKISKKLELIYEKIEKVDPDYVTLRRAKSIPLKELKKKILKNNLIIVEYYMSKTRILIFVLTANKIIVKTVSISRKQFLRYFNNYLQDVHQYPKFLNSNNSHYWLKLQKFLIRPISELLIPNRTINFVPHDLLHYIPLHALKRGRQPIIVKNPVVYSSNVSLIQFYGNKGSGKLETCASFGVSFEDEAKRVAKIFDSNPILKATKKDVLNNLDRDILHFSCHGLFNKNDPLSSCIFLQDDDPLTTREIFDLKLDSELVTLSACETGINENAIGDELIGLTRSFLYAGAASLVVTLWKVDSISSSELMNEFYRNIKNCDSKALALQKAQIKLMKNDRFSHPFFWAPFILIGNPN